MKIIFFGTPYFIEPIINTLEDSFELVKVIRKPIEFDNKTLSEIEKLNPDLFVVAAYGKILPDKLLEIPKLGGINVHPSLLPKYRGPSPIQNAILNGDEKTGVTIIKMDEQMDHGPILKQIEDTIQPTDTFQALAERLFQKSVELLKDVISDYNDIKPTTQDESKVTFTKLITKQDGLIDPENPPEKEKFLKMIRAFYPWPGVWIKYGLSGKEVVIKLLPEERIQVEGKKPMSFKDFKNGYENGEEFLKKLDLN